MEDALYLAVNRNADINTTYSMGTAAMTLLAALLWTCTYIYNAVGVGTAFHPPARVNAAPFSAVGIGVMLPILLLLVLPFTLLLGYMLPLFLRLV